MFELNEYKKKIGYNTTNYIYLINTMERESVTLGTKWLKNEEKKHL